MKRTLILQGVGEDPYLLSAFLLFSPGISRFWNIFPSTDPSTNLRNFEPDIANYV
jgi:hypothetical protein